MNYDPREFWDQRLTEHFDLRGTGETGLSLDYNRACYALRGEALGRALAAAGVDPRGRSVLDVGCGSGYFTAWYLHRGARVTGIDIAPVSVERLARRHPQARFVLGDVSEAPLEGSWDIVNAFDVLYHVTDEARWERAVRHLAAATAPGGVFVLTDTFAPRPGAAVHNRMRPLARWRELLEPSGFALGPLQPTAVLLNRELGPFRLLNRAPALLLALDRVLLRLGLGHDAAVSKILVARRTA